MYIQKWEEYCNLTACADAVVDYRHRQLLLCKPGRAGRPTHVVLMNRPAFEDNLRLFVGLDGLIDFILWDIFGSPGNWARNIIVYGT